MITSKLIVSLFIATAVMAGHAAFAQTPSLSAKLEAARVVTSVEGKDVRSAADSVKPGDVVEYSATYANAGTAAVSNVLAVVPVPVGTTFVVDSASPGNAQASVDGKTFAAMPLKRTVKLADGKLREELVPALEYRAVRWNIANLQAKKDAVVRLRVQINPPVLTAATAIAATANK